MLIFGSVVFVFHSASQVVMAFFRGWFLRRGGYPESFVFDNVLNKEILQFRLWKPIISIKISQCQFPRFLVRNSIYKNVSCSIFF